jgi:hypothetical protein
MDGMKEHGWGGKQIDKEDRERERDRQRGHHVKDEPWSDAICVYGCYNTEEPNTYICKE